MKAVSNFLDYRRAGHSTSKYDLKAEKKISRDFLSQHNVPNPNAG